MTMDFDRFQASLQHDEPPAELSRALQALWYVRNGHWDQAHELAQAEPGPEGAWVHAHLHRLEGDEGNAGYWYRRAGRPACRDALDAEWEAICRALLGDSGAD